MHNRGRILINRFGFIFVLADMSHLCLCLNVSAWNQVDGNTFSGVICFSGLDVWRCLTSCRFTCAASDADTVRGHPGPDRGRYCLMKL